jgi:predicted Zn-dependent protease
MVNGSKLAAVDAAAWETQAHQASRSGDRPGALLAWRKVCELRPEDPVALRRLALLLLELNQPEEAARFAKRVLGVSPGCSISRDVLKRARAH